MGMDYLSCILAVMLIAVFIILHHMRRQIDILYELIDLITSTTEAAKENEKWVT